MGAFNMPPGCSPRDIPGNDCDGPCLVCCKFIDDCICPECTTCNRVGEPRCYEDIEPDEPIKSHGLRLTDEQKRSRAAYEQYCKEQNEYWDKYSRADEDRDTEDFSHLRED